MRRRLLVLSVGFASLGGMGARAQAAAPAARVAAAAVPQDDARLHVNRLLDGITLTAVQRARVDRGGDVGIDLPAGATASELRPVDYHPVDMEPPARAAHAPRTRAAKTHAAEVERPGDVGMDLPAGAAAGELRPVDYHPVDMESTVAPRHAPRR